MRVLAVRHVGFEDLGTLAAVLRQRGAEITYREAADGFDGIDPAAPDLIVILGGPIGAYEGADYPFLLDEQRLLEHRIAAGRPLLESASAPSFWPRPWARVSIRAGGRRSAGARWSSPRPAFGRH